MKIKLLIALVAGLFMVTACGKKGDLIEPVPTQQKEQKSDQ